MNLQVVTARVFLGTGYVMVLMIAEMVATKPQTVDPDAVGTAACYNRDHQIPSHSCYSDIEDKLNSLRASLSHVPSHLHKLDEIDNWVKEQKKKKKKDEKSGQIPIEDLGKVLQAMVSGIEKFKSEDPLEITKGVLDIISTTTSLVSGPFGPIIEKISGGIGAILSHKKPKEPSVVDQLAKVVHKELVNFNKKLHDQKYEGLKRRVSDQTAQLRTMKPGEKLDDPNLWNDYVQFLGELSNRFESPLPFKYDTESLTKDPDIADFVTAVVAYCQAYSCFMALLMAAKGTFANLGAEYNEDEEAVERKIRCQREDVEEKLAFLSDERYLTFLGRLPYEGGKLTKILVLSRKLSAKRLVEAVRSSLNMLPMPNLAIVEAAATKVSLQKVNVPLEDRHQLPPGDGLTWMLSSVFGTKYWIQFVDKTDFPMKVVSGTVGLGNRRLKFFQDVYPHSSHSLGLEGMEFGAFPFSTGGYFIIYLNGILSSDIEPPTGDSWVIEFAASFLLGLLESTPAKVNIQDKTSGEFTHGADTHNSLKSGEAKTLYWLDRGVHFMARAEIVNCFGGVTIWRFVVQNFDPFAVH